MLGINGMAQWVKCPLNKAGTQVCLTPNKLEGELNHKGVLSHLRMHCGMLVFGFTRKE